MTRGSPGALLAVDAGGSTGRAAINCRGATSVHVIKSALNPVDVGYPLFEKRIRKLVIPLIDQLDDRRIQLSACAAVAGAGDPDIAAACRRIITRVVASRSKRPRVRVLSDLDALIECFLAREDGIVLIAGTGSVCAGVAHGAGRATRVRVGGRGGHLDRGSGFRMGFEVLESALRARDGLEEVNDTVRLLCGREGISLEDVPRAYLPPQRDRIASLARIALEACEAGDPFARRLVRGAVRDLTDMVLAVGTRAGLGPRVTIEISGGMFRDKTVARRFRRRIGRALPQAQLNHVTNSLLPLLQLAGE